MSNFVIHRNNCCFCKTEQLVYNHQCGINHTEPTLICQTCAESIAKAIAEYTPDEEEYYDHI